MYTRLTGQVNRAPSAELLVCQCLASASIPTLDQKTPIWCDRRNTVERSEKEADKLEAASAVWQPERPSDLEGYLVKVDAHIREQDLPLRPVKAGVHHGECQ